VRQIVIARHGPAEVLRLREAQDPVPGTGEVRIAVRAIGVNFADVLARLGLYPDAPPVPFVPGYEVAGVIDAVGERDSRHREGDRVLALTRFGGYSTSVVVQAAHALAVPSRLSDEEAAAIPVNYLTAYVALYKLGNVEPGETVLVHSAGGGVGIAAIQLAHLRRAAIVGTASARKHEALRTMGVEHLIDPSAADVSTEVLKITAGRGVDVVLDPIGGRHLRDSYRLLAPLGRLITFGAASVAGEKRNWLRLARVFLQMPAFRPMALINSNRGVLGLNLGRLWSEEQRIGAMMAEILEHVEDGRLRPIIAASFPLEDPAGAHRYLQSRSNIGKVILTTS
jgi:synaptic vesicle membrane protein VAT-1